MEDALDSLNWNFVIRVREAYARRQNKAQNASAGLLVGSHCFDQSGRRNARPWRQRPEPTNKRHDARNVFRRSETDFVSEKSSGDHTPSDGLAVLIAAITRDAFQSVGKSVAKIENFAQT